MSTFEQRAKTATQHTPASLEQTETSPRLPDEAETTARTLFVVCRGRTLEYPLPDSGVVVIGRGHDADVHIDHPTLSRRHAKLTLGACVMVEDNHSRNGTRLGGRMLGPGEVAIVSANVPIELGDALLIVRPANTSSGVVDVVTPTERVEVEVSLVRSLLRIADAEMSVLLFGEPGAGKAYLARRVHQLSRRSRGPLVELDCTSATARAHIAATAASACGGVLVIHEPAELSPSDQVELASALSREGDTIRLITITTRDLGQLVARRVLTPGLARRLAGISLVVPPLRERIHELPGIAQSLVTEIAVAHGRPIPQIEPGVFTVLARHSWPGNVHELKEVLTRAVLSCEAHVIIGADITASVSDDKERATDSDATSLSTTVAVAERRRIVDALRACHGNQTRAARMLGISRGTLISRLERYGVPRPRK